ncbi:MAG: phosphatase PAP2 family protein [Rhodothermales bacterium]
MLLALVVLGAGAYGFAHLAEVVTEGDAQTVDERLLLLFRHADDLADPIGGVAVEEAVRDLTALGGVLLTSLVTLLAVGYFLLDGRPRAAGFLVASVLSGVAVTFALKSGFDRPRPDLVAHQMEALSASFPSGHSATAAVVYLTLGALLARALPRRRLKVYVVATAVVVTLAIGISRIYLGVHWPTDVLAGWTIGAAWALAAWLVERYFRRRGWIERGSTLV